MSPKLAEAYKVAQSLPEDAQEVIALEMLQEVSHLSRSAMTPEQVGIVTDRLSRPFVYASDEDVERIVGKL